MKILTKEEEQAHYDATIRGGFAGGAAGFIIVRMMPSSELPQLICSRVEQLPMAPTFAFRPFALSLFL